MLDLFGGTGAISYEFASRGASMVYCVEMLPLHANFIKSQAAKFGMNNLTVVRHNVFEFLEICREKFDIIFADPPYALEDLATIPDKVFAKDILHPGAYLILEHPEEFNFESHPYFVKERNNETNDKQAQSQDPQNVGRISLPQWGKGDRLRWMRCQSRFTVLHLYYSNSNFSAGTPHPSDVPKLFLFHNSVCTSATFPHWGRL